MTDRSAGSPDPQAGDSTTQSWQLHYAVVEAEGD